LKWGKKIRGYCQEAKKLTERKRGKPKLCFIKIEKNVFYCVKQPGKRQK